MLSNEMSEERSTGGVGLFKLLWNILVPYSAELDAFGNMKESPQVTREELLKMKKERINAYNITRRRRISTLPIFL